MKRLVQQQQSDELTGHIVNVLQMQFGAAVVRTTRRPSAYRSSFALEEVDVEFASSGTHSFILKHSGSESLHPLARQAKPEFVLDPSRESLVYRHLLSPELHGTAVCYAVLEHPQGNGPILLLEKVPGRELYQIGEVEIWEDVARWLATFHRSMASSAQATPPELKRHLIDYDAKYFHHWLERAREYRASDARASDFVRWLAPRFAAIVDAVCALPTTLIHGELYASNVMVVPGMRPRICPIDWETAGYGTGLLDVAALVSGDWSDEQRRRLLTAYTAGLGDGSDPATLWLPVQCCRLIQCIQWLGWSATWQPPQEHRQDWLQTATIVAHQLCS